MSCCMQITLNCNKKEYPIIEKILYSYNVQSISIEDDADEMIFGIKVSESKIWKKIKIKALFFEEDKIDFENIKEEIEKFCNVDVLHTFKVEKLQNKNWQAICQKNFKPINIQNKLLITPSWADIPQDFQRKSTSTVQLDKSLQQDERSHVLTNKNVIFLDPGRSFGTGAHPTTYLCLDWLVNNIVEGKSNFVKINEMNEINEKNGKDDGNERSEGDEVNEENKANKRNEIIDEKFKTVNSFNDKNKIENKYNFSSNKDNKNKFKSKSEINQKNSAPVLVDYGCGSGILGISALKLGAKKVYAIDNDRFALESTIKNAEQNNILVNEELFCFLPEEMQTFNIKANIVIANILVNPLIELKEILLNLLDSSSTLVLSGILEEQIDFVLENYKNFFNTYNVYKKDGWCLVEFFF